MKRTLYPKLLGGYLIYGLICFIIISTFGYHITFNFLERRDASTLYRESALISSNYAENYFKRSTTLEEMKTQLSTLSTYLSSEIWIIDKQGQILLSAFAICACVTVSKSAGPTPISFCQSVPSKNPMKEKYQMEPRKLNNFRL